MYEAKSIYVNSPLDIEPNWHIIFLLLKEKKELPVTEIAQILGFSHPAIIKIAKKMTNQGYLDIVNHPSDSRKKLLRLSEKSLKKLEEFEAQWKVIGSVIKEVVDKKFLDKLDKVETLVNNKTLVERYKAKIKNE